LVVFASTLLLKLMGRWPVIITLGAALLGWVAGEMAVSDVVSKAWIEARASWPHILVPAVGAVLVVVIGKWLAARKQARIAATPLVDLAVSDNDKGEK
jgi:predicted tellurium resistance membrane protein TerC